MTTSFVLIVILRLSGVGAVAVPAPALAWLGDRPATGDVGVAL